MTEAESTPRRMPCRASRAACGACLATASALLLFGTHPAAARTTQATVDQADVAIAAVPIVIAEFAAAPAVSCPLDTVARFSVSPLASVADVVDVLLSREAGLTRFGGRCGP